MWILSLVTESEAYGSVHHLSTIDQLRKNLEGKENEMEPAEGALVFGYY